MSRALLLSVRFHDGRYHGAGDWPPAPARLFQALVAGAARGRTLTDEQKAALLWFEGLEPPAIATPVVRRGGEVLIYVPNNDLDAVDGDPSRVGEIRTGKTLRPWLFDPQIAFLYGWTFSGEAGAEDKALAVCRAARDLYQLGRGIDSAWAEGEVISAIDLESRLLAHGAVLHRPAGSEGNLLLCPAPGSFESLVARFEATLRRFEAVRRGKRTQTLFLQPPKPRFRAISYDSPPHRFLFDLQRPTGVGVAAPWPQTETLRLVEAIRTAATARLQAAFNDKAALIDRVVVGRGAGVDDKSARVRFVPIPSIGHEHVGQQIRRVLIEVPANCPLSAGDIGWSCSGLGITTADTGEVTHVLVKAATRKMLTHYGIESEDGERLWRTVTPAALPQSSARRRLAPERLHDPVERKGAAERAAEEGRAIGAVVQALRHAGIAGAPQSIRVQREPFAVHGARAEAFADGTRFAKERLWHVEVAFAGDVRGPIVIGDGRYLGLGLMAPHRTSRPAVFEFRLLAAPAIVVADRAPLLHAVRRALMALSRDRSGEVPRLFSGHEADGAPAGSGGHEHVFLGAADTDGDGCLDRLIVAAPWTCDRTVSAAESAKTNFSRVVGSLEEIRAGRVGLVRVTKVETSERWLGSGDRWCSHSLYRPTRHPSRGKPPADALIADVMIECTRRGLPRPAVSIEALNVGRRGGNVEARLKLRFATAVEGPIMLGRDCHSGGGLFEVSSGQ